MSKDTKEKVAPFRIGFIGAGGIAGTHAKHLQGVDGVVIQAAADVSESNLEKFQSEWGAREVYSDYHEMLQNAELDAVSICTPNFLHKQPAIDALNAGLHVLVEKPMAMSAPECVEMIDAAKKAGKQLMVAYQWRFSPQARFLRKQVEDGVVGDVKYLRVQALRRRGIPSWGVFGQKEKQGGGALIDIGVHIMEMAHHIIGKPKPVTVSAMASTYLGDKKPAAMPPWGEWDHTTYTVEDLAVGFVRFDNGATMTVESSFAAHIRENVWNIQIMGTEGGLNYDPLELYTDRNGYMLNCEPSFIGKQSGFEYKMRHFVEVCRDGVECEAPGEDGLAVQQIIDALYESAEKGREVEV